MKNILRLMIFGFAAITQQVSSKLVITVYPPPLEFTVNGFIQWNDGSPTDDPAVLGVETVKSNLPVTIYRKNDLLGMIFPTLDFKVLTSLSNPSNSAVLSWVTDTAGLSQQVQNCDIVNLLSRTSSYPIPAALYGIVMIMITPSVPWKYSGEILDVNGVATEYIFKKDSTYSDASGTVDMITSAKTKLATYVGIKKSGDSPGGSFSLKITKLLKQSKLNLAQFIDGKSVCSQYSRNNFNNLTNMMVNVPTVDGSYKIINAATYLLFQEGNNLTGFAAANKKDDYPNRVDYIPGPKASNQSSYSVGGKEQSILRVRNQAPCNSCYAFGAAAALEGALYTQSNGSFSVYFSPQYLSDCETIESRSCTPGFGSYEPIFERLIRRAGTEVPLTANIPFSGMNGKCRKVKGFPTGLTKYMNVTTSDDAKNALVNYGSIVTAVASKYFNSPHIEYPKNAAAVAKGQEIPQAVNECPYNGPDVDHAVTIVGWNPCTLSRPEYGPNPINTTCWKVLNSWGTSVGYAGFYFVPMNNSIDCGSISTGNARALMLDPSKMPAFKN